MRDPYPYPSLPDRYNQYPNGSFGNGPGADPPPKRSWWRTLTTPPGDPDDVSLPLRKREQLRRGQLAGIIVIGLAVVDLVFIPATLDQPSNLAAILIVFAACFGAAILNRYGQVTAAGYTLVFVLFLAVAAVFLTAPVVSLDYFPVYDLLIIPLLLAAAILPRGHIFFVAALNSAFIIADAILQPHGTLDISSADGLSLIVKQVALQIIAAIVLFLLARSNDRALAKADRAEELRRAEHALASQRQQLEVGINQILETHVRAANGDFKARAPLARDNVLFQISASLNNLLSRLQKAGEAENQLARTNEEISRLAAALDDLSAGRHPIWPAQTGTAADLLLMRLSGRNRQQLSQGQSGQALRPGTLPGQSFGARPARLPVSPPTSMPPMVPPIPGMGPGAGSRGGISDLSGMGGMGSMGGMEGLRQGGPAVNSGELGNAMGNTNRTNAMGQMAGLGQMPLVPPMAPLPQNSGTSPNVSSAPLDEENWPSLDGFSEENGYGGAGSTGSGGLGGYATDQAGQSSRATNAQLGGSSFPPLESLPDTANNPWYLPPDE